MRQSHKTLALWVLLLLMLWAIFQIINKDSTRREDIEFSKFRQLVVEGKVKEVEISLTGQGTAGVFEGKFNDDHAFRTTGVLSEAVEKSLEDQKVRYKIEPKAEPGLWHNVLLTWLPMIFLVVIFFFFMRQLQSGGGKAMSFGKSKAKLMNENQNKITFGGCCGRRRGQRGRPRDHRVSFATRRSSRVSVVVFRRVFC